MIDDHDWESTAPVLDDTLRRLAPRSCVGHREREPGRLQLRFVIDVDEHMHDIVVVEDDDTVVVSAAVCSPTTGVWKDQVEAPFHVYLDEPLGERRVIDALTGREVPYKDVWAELAAEEAAEAATNGGGPPEDCMRMD
jgi:hypothetical protein